MTIPPFPSQDLAKLVLGYLAEEQLMTAYDEFLQASPYLDAFRNEYDRIFMTSLKNILAEYRAVKIYVETCKPFLLRRKMLQCSNLLEVVKLLITYADISKIQSQDGICDRTGISKHSTSGGLKQNICDICASLNLAACVCQSKQNRSVVQSGSHGDKSTENSVETTALEDLPGNQITTRKKHTRVVEKDSSFESNLDVSDNTRQSTSGGINSNQSSIIKYNEIGSLNLSSIVKVTDTPECREKMEEFNNILNKVCNNKSMSDTRMYSTSESESLSRKTSNNSFQNIAPTGSGQENRNIPVPDSSTSENSISVQTLSKENITSVSQTSSESKDINDRVIQTSNYPYPRIKPRCNDKKLK